MAGGRLSLPRTVIQGSGLASSLEEKMCADLPRQIHNNIINLEIVLGAWKGLEGALRMEYIVN